MPFEPGHQLSPKAGTRPKHIYDTILRTVAQNPAKLKAAIQAQIDAAADGDLDALDWIACRLEGKATQAITSDSTLAITIDVDRPKLTPGQWLAHHGVIDVIPSVINDLPAQTTEERMLIEATPVKAERAPLSAIGASE